MCRVVDCGTADVPLDGPGADGYKRLDVPAQRVEQLEAERAVLGGTSSDVLLMGRGSTAMAATDSTQHSEWIDCGYPNS
eukprot:2606754-Pleurochrysis_carterae.AAC.3